MEVKVCDPPCPNLEGLIGDAMNAISGILPKKKKYFHVQLGQIEKEAVPHKSTAQ